MRGDNESWCVVSFAIKSIFLVYRVLLRLITSCSRGSHRLRHRAVLNTRQRLQASVFDLKILLFCGKSGHFGVLAFERVAIRACFRYLRQIDQPQHCYHEGDKDSVSDRSHAQLRRICNGVLVALPLAFPTRRSERGGCLFLIIRHVVEFLFYCLFCMPLDVTHARSNSARHVEIRGHAAKTFAA